MSLRNMVSGDARPSKILSRIQFLIVHYYAAIITDSTTGPACLSVCASLEKKTKLV